MRKRVFLSLLAALLVLTASACGGGGDSGVSSAGGSSAPQAPSSEAMDFGYGENDSAGAVDGAVQEAKIIRTAEMNLETTSFDEAEAGLNRLVEDVGGYFENSVLHSGGSRRWANYAVRVPAARFQDFLDRAGELCHLTWRTQNAENVTEAYYDAEGRLKTQQIKLERLQELLSRAEAMEDIITIESAISETEYMIDSLSGTLRHYDALVDYATVHVSLEEVYRLSNVEEVPDSFGSRLATAFTSGISNFGEAMENLIVALAYSWMWLLILAAIVIAVVRLTRRRERKEFSFTRKKKDDSQSKL